MNNDINAKIQQEPENSKVEKAAEADETEEYNKFQPPQDVQGIEKVLIPEEVKKSEEDRLKEERMERRNTLHAYRSIDYSGFLERLFARGVDFGIVAGIIYLTYRINPVKAIAGALIFDMVHRIVFTYFFGATIGKFIFGVRVISRASSKLTIWQVLVREFAKFISMAFLNFGYLSIIFSRRKRAWHDIIAGTAVTSGGREEARYGREVYGERPEKYDIRIGAAITLVFVAVIAFSINLGAFYIINYKGLLGFIEKSNSLPEVYRYKLPSEELGLAGVNKNLVQVGDIKGDGGYTAFIETIKEEENDKKEKISRIVIRELGPNGKILQNGIEFVSDKPIIQYRLLDINGDKKDELAVLFDDKVLKIYKFQDGIGEIGSFGPLDYKEINAVVKGKPADNVPYRLYILGDKNKITIISMKDGKVENQKFDLPDDYTFIDIDMGRFSDKNYLVALTDGGKIVFYNYDGKEYKRMKDVILPFEDVSSMTIKDINLDGVNDILVTYSITEKRPYPMTAAYDVSQNNLKLIWDGGRFYRSGDKKVNLTLDEGGDMDKDKNFEAYMVSKEISGQDGSFVIYNFKGNKYLFKLNDVIRNFSFFSPK